MPCIITIIIKQRATYVEKYSRGLRQAVDYKTAILKCHL